MGANTRVRKITLLPLLWLLLAAGAFAQITIAPGGSISIQAGPGGSGSPFTTGGDVSGTSGALQVIGLQGNTLPGLSAGYLHWNGTAFVYDLPTSVVTFSGDVNGDSASQTVVGLQGNALPTLAVGYLYWNGTAFAYQSSLSSPTFTGTVTFGGILGATQCLHVSSTGVVSGTGADCGSGGGGSMVYPGAGIALSSGSGWSTSIAAPSSSLVGVSDIQILTNKTVDGVSPTTLAFLDATSSVQSQLNAKVTGTAPTGAIVGTTDTQTLTNKTLDGVLPSTLAYLANVTSDAQTQLNAKAPSASPVFTGTVTLPVTGSTQCLHANSTGIVSGTGADCGSGSGSMVYPTAGIPVSTGAAWAASIAAPSSALVGISDTQALTNKTVDGVSPTTIGYLDATSSVQTQLNLKLPLAGGTLTGPVVLPADPTTNLQAATKQYVDSHAGGGMSATPTTTTSVVQPVPAPALTSILCRGRAT